MIFLENKRFEIQPLFGKHEFSLQCNKSINHPRNAHLIKMKFKSQNEMMSHIIGKRENKLKKDKLTIEVAVFTDVTLYQNFLPITNGNAYKFREIIFGLMAGVNSIFQHSSFGIPMEIVVVKYFKQLDHSRLYRNYNESASDLLNSFCAYQKNVKNTSNSWDLALLLTGRDLYRKGTKNFAVNGMANISTMCSPDSCAIAEFGVSKYKSIYTQTKGFNAIYTIAHEIGHT